MNYNEDFRLIFRNTIFETSLFYIIFLFFVQLNIESKTFIIPLADIILTFMCIYETFNYLIKNKRDAKIGICISIIYTVKLAVSINMFIYTIILKDDRKKAATYLSITFFICVFYGLCAIFMSVIFLFW